MTRINIINIILFSCLLISCDKNNPEREPSTEVAMVEAAEAISIDELSPVEDGSMEIVQDSATQTINERVEEEAVPSFYEEKVISQDELKIFFESIFDPSGIDLYASSWECFGFESTKTIEFLGKTLDMFSCTNIALEYMLKDSPEKEETLRKDNITQLIENYESNFERGFMPSKYNDVFPVKLLWEQHEDDAFGYVNHNAVRWLRHNIIPSPDMDISGVRAQELYDRILQNFCRSMMFYYRYLHNELNLEKELRWYNRMMNDEDFNAAGDWLNFRYNQQEYLQPGIMMSEKQTPAYFIGFWLRRNIDGSDEELRQGLEDILTVYDQTWLEKLNKNYNK